MADLTSTSCGGADLNHRIGELIQRWLPMMLWRVGVPTSQTARLRESFDGDQGLRDRLDFAQGVVMFASMQPRESHDSGAELAASVIAIVSELRLAFDLRDRDLDGAQRRVDRVNRQLIRMVVGAPASPGADRSSHVEFGSGSDANFTQSPWWSRLIFRNSSVGRWAHY